MKTTVHLEQREKDLLAYIKRNADKSNLFICDVVHVSRSGMQREIKVGMVYKGEFVRLTYLVAKLIGSKIGNNYGVKVGGCGMDMIFHTLDCFLSAFMPKGGNNYNSVQHYGRF